MTAHPVLDSTPPEDGAQERSPRWHHLDALRGFAMVLGIGLHVSLAFFPWVWPAQDVTSNIDGFYDEFFHAVHGFRMPLFFLLSGFFTAMLWRRRGLRSLVEHRIRRIAIPLALGMVTIVPVMNWSIDWAIDNGVSDYIEETGDIWAAAFFGNDPAVAALLEQGTDVNAANPADSGNTPLHMAASTNDVAMAVLLLAEGADPSVASADGTPMDYAVWFGNREVAEVLLAAGAVDYRPPNGEWDDISFWAEGAGTLDEEAGLGLESWLSSFYHLWFLWFLLWLVAGFAVFAFLADRLGSSAESPGQWSGVVMWALIPITLVPQLAMGDGGTVPVFGPDTSTGLVPIPHVLAYYAVFFAFGALLYGRRNRQGGLLVETLGKSWMLLLPLTAFVVLPVALRLTFDPADTSWFWASALQVAYAWAAIVSLMGLFRSFLARRRRGVRYLSDSAYWLYLVHLPLVIVAQSWIRNWDLPAGVKAIGLTVCVSAVLLITYQLFVRYTPIGTLLNGKRTRPRSAPATVAGGEEREVGALSR